MDERLLPEEQSAREHRDGEGTEGTDRATGTDDATAPTSLSPWATWLPLAVLLVGGLGPWIMLGDGPWLLTLPPSAGVAWAVWQAGRGTRGATLADGGVGAGAIAGMCMYLIAAIVNGTTYPPHDGGFMPGLEWSMLPIHLILAGLCAVVGAMVGGIAALLTAGVIGLVPRVGRGDV